VTTPGGIPKGIRNMDGQGGIEERCGNCSSLVPEDEGYENGRGDLLCTECFVDQWGPSTEELTMSFGAHQAGVATDGSLGSLSIWSEPDMSSHS
jgi:hypothetical protein